MRHCLIPLFLLFFVPLGCTSPTEQHESAPPFRLDSVPAQHPEETPFDIRVFVDPAEADSNAQVALIAELDLPSGSYVISALSDRDYLGKFQVDWKDTAIAPAGKLRETPPSVPGWEPFDKVYTPMLMESSTLSQTWSLPSGMGPFDGRIFFVLEPQCVPYALDFTVEKEPDGWSCTYGMVYPSYPD